MPAFLIWLVGVTAGVAALVLENVYRYRTFCKIKADKKFFSKSDKVRDVSAIDCRVCKKSINLEDPTNFVACYHPSGIAHFGSHIVCLGIYPDCPEDRASLRAWYRCIQHSKK